MDVLDLDVQVEQSSDADYDVWLEVSVEADFFSCPLCHLVLDGFELISEAKLSESFNDVGEITALMGPE
jgi:preprotein translocase subunit SecB